MKKIALYICLFILTSYAFTVGEVNEFSSAPGSDTLPNVLPQNHADIIGSKLKNEAYLRFAQHQLPTTKQEWEKYRTHLKNAIIEKAGVVIDHRLPFNYQETGTEKMEGYSIKKIIFQTRPGVYATANLYIPDGKGPFPAVINMNGHWPEAKMADMTQSVGHTLALNGYVCLNIDAFGSGERSTIHGEYEYHGYNLGASLMNLGESLMGFQISENIRGVDLLSSLPYVDAKHIGATGASGGGNQTLCLTAIDERIKASMPVVSIGTFESYVMDDNCICELLIDGLTLTEESGVLSLIAPRAIKMCNHKQDDIPPFFPQQMLRTYNNVKPVFKMLGAENNIAYEVFNLTHGYWPEDRAALLGWFNLHLKGIGDGTPTKEIPFKTLSDQPLMVYAKGKRDPKVATIAEYCEQKGIELRNNLLSAKTINLESKRKELKSILRITEKPSIKKVHQYSNVSGWDRFALETSDDKLLPVLHLSPGNKTLGYVILCNDKGKAAISPNIIDDLKKKGYGIVIPDLSGTGETSSPKSDTLDGTASFHTISRAALWLGRTVMGEWVNELDLITGFLRSRYHAQSVSIDGSREAGLAALFLGALEGRIDDIILRDAPVSYLFDNCDSINFYSMAIHIPGFLKWGDVSLAAGLFNRNVRFINPLTISGQK
ncbi:MAG TPA: acetylxylan esterase, partial [Saprospiraceae bacterium]|nr:acetylxylan esterase [Saprospiraceae bacterium]